MDDKSLQKPTVDDSADLTLDKDTWICIYGSLDLQQARSLGYECKERYLKERIESEYKGFKINHSSAAKKLDFPPKYAIKESFRWNDAYIAEHHIDGEVFAVDRYMGEYQIIKKVRKPWYISSKQWLLHDNLGSIVTMTIIITLFYALLSNLIYIYKLAR
jgi:hypothetical protein